MTFLLAQRIFELLNCKIAATEKQKNTACDKTYRAWNRAFKNSFRKKTSDSLLEKNNLYIPTQDILWLRDYLSPFNIPKELLLFI